MPPGRSRPFAFPMHFPTAFGPSQAVSFALECNLRRFFSSGFVLKHPYIMQMRLLAGIRKKCHFETAIKVNAQVMCITKPSPVAAPFVSLPVSLFLSSLQTDLEHFRVGSCWVFIANIFVSPHQQTVFQSTKLTTGVVRQIY